jgi:hypothetical protein
MVEKETLNASLRYRLLIILWSILLNWHNRRGKKCWVRVRRGMAATTCHHVSMVGSSCETYFYYCPAVVAAAIGSWPLRREVAATTCHHVSMVVWMAVTVKRTFIYCPAVAAAAIGSWALRKPVVTSVFIQTDMYQEYVAETMGVYTEREVWWRKMLGIMILLTI